MKRYFLRSVKYFIWLMALLVIVYALMLLFGQTNYATLQSVIHTGRIWWLVGAILVVTVAYPRFGYTARELRGRVTPDENRDKVLSTMEMNGYMLTQEMHGVMTFRSGTFAGRLRRRFEDKVEVKLNGDKIIISGPRNEVVRTELRLKTLL